MGRSVFSGNFRTMQTESRLHQHALTNLRRTARPPCMASQNLISESPESLVARLAHAGRAAQRVLARLSDEQKSAALVAAAAALRAAGPDILAANARDMAAGAARGLSDALLDRLRLDPARLTDRKSVV